MINKASVFLLLLILLWSRIGWASTEPHLAGARSAGMGGITVTLSDVWAAANNIAGITNLPKPVLGTYAENRFNLKAFSTVSLQGVYPLQKYGAVGLDFSRFGDKLYNEQHLGVGFAHKLGPVSLGIKTTVLQLHLEGLGNKRAVAFSFGGQSEVIPKLIFGAHIFNLTQVRVASFQDERFPTVMTAGLAYKAGQKVLLSVETAKELEQAANIRAGLEYYIIDKLALRSGFTTANQKITAGLGYKAKALQVDFAMGGHTVLGFSNHISISFQIE
ncbi:hypothetical protein [Adhaeribacter aquaticus]|uniref:hypothetical protein n=1 Tax=Adhaeribacter aquaticus TaxID=299567 RepID=UPI000411D04A|nr:hypothetical protein [Adhaeribacter aquaticus]